MRWRRIGAIGAHTPSSLAEDEDEVAVVEDVVDDHHPAKFLLPSMRAASAASSSSTASTHITPRMPQASNINPPTPIQQTHHGKKKLFIDFKCKIEPVGTVERTLLTQPRILLTYRKSYFTQKLKTLGKNKGHFCYTRI